MSELDDLERLAGLREQGLLSEEEFGALKGRVLAPSARTIPTAEPAGIAARRGWKHLILSRVSKSVVAICAALVLLLLLSVAALAQRGTFSPPNAQDNTIASGPSVATIATSSPTLPAVAAPYEATSTPLPAATAPPTRAPESPALRLGSPAKYFNGWQITVLAIDEQQPIRNIQPTIGNRLVTVTIKAENLGVSGAEQVTYLNFLIGGDFEPRFAATGTVLMPRGFVSKTLAPSESFTGTVTFEVPVGASKLVLVYTDEVYRKPPRYPTTYWTLY